MNTNTHQRRTATSVRRAVPALAIVVLAIGLGACQTPPRGEAVPKAPVIQPAEVPQGIDTSRPADRIEAELERRAQLEYEAQLTKSVSVQYRGRTADTIDRLTSDNDRFAGVPVDRIVEQLEREANGAPRFY